LYVNKILSNLSFKLYPCRAYYNVNQKPQKHSEPIKYTYSSSKIIFLLNLVIKSKWLGQLYALVLIERIGKKMFASLF